jgi:replicative DNA helicase
MGTGDPVAVDPDLMVIPVQRGLLGALRKAGSGPLSLEAAQNALAGEFSSTEVVDEFKRCAMADATFTDASFTALLALLRRERTSAKLRAAALEVVASLRDGETPEGVAQKVKGMVELTQPEVGNEIESIGDNAHQLFEGQDDNFVPHGLACLDELRVVPGNLCVLAARPGGGKTALLGTWTLAAARAGWRVLFLSLEMPSKQIRQRLLSGMSGIPLPRILRPNDAEMVPFVHKLGEFPIGIRDAVAGETLTVERIASLTRAYRRRYPGEKVVVMVDYLQLVKARDKYDIRYQLLGHVCRELKATALREGVPMVVAAQIGRGVEQRGKEAKPQLSDLRESGEIENTADQVILVHREMMSPMALLAVAKYRMGAPFVAQANFDGEHCLFTDAGSLGWQ